MQSGSRARSCRGAARNEPSVVARHRDSEAKQSRADVVTESRSRGFPASASSRATNAPTSTGAFLSLRASPQAAKQSRAHARHPLYAPTQSTNASPFTAPLNGVERGAQQRSFGVAPPTAKLRCRSPETRLTRRLQQGLRGGVPISDAWRASFLEGRACGSPPRAGQLRLNLLFFGDSTWRRC